MWGYGRSMPPTVDLRLVASFRVLGDELHFARAAARLSIAQPTLSQQIRRLERQMGVELFRRSSRRVELTPAGLVLLPAAGEGLDAIDRGIAAARREAGRATRYTVAVEFDLGDAWLDAIRRHAAGGRPFRIRAVRLHETHALEALRAGEIDAALHWTPPEVSGLPGRRVGEVPALVAMRGDHPLAARPVLTRADLAGVPFAMFERDDSPGLWDHYAGLLTGGRPRDLVAADIPTMGASQPVLLDAVRGTDRLTIVTRDFWAAADRHGLAAVPLDPPLVLPVFWSTARAAATGDALASLVAAIEAVLPAD